MLKIHEMSLRARTVKAMIWSSAVAYAWSDPTPHEDQECRMESRRAGRPRKARMDLKKWLH